MAINITMPALSPTMESGKLSKWLVKEGDSVSSGDVIAEIETDKATMEVEAVDEGVIAKILVDEGTADVAVNAVIAILAEEGEDVDAVGSQQGQAAPTAAQAEPAAQSAANSTQQANKPVADQAVEKTADAGPVVKSQSGERVFSSPLARRLAQQAGIDIASVKGTGPRGRVIKRDVDAAVQSGSAKPQAAAATENKATAAKAPNDQALLSLFNPDEYELVPHDGMRKTIARRLVEAKQTIPHFYVTVDCEIDALLGLRKQLNDAAPKIEKDGAASPAYKLSVNDMVIKAAAMALKQVPDANVSWLEDAMVKHKFADIGVAVSIPGGLITPIIRHADEKSLSTISNEMKDLAKRARERKLKPSEYEGGCSSVSNMGMYGVKEFSAIINPPHASIFAVGAGEQRAVVKNGEITVANIMSVTISADHRAVDGALAAQLAQAFKQLVENPMAMLV